MNTMIKPAVIKILILLLISAFAGCSVYKTKPIEVTCPVYEQNCSADPWHGLDMDTSVESSKLLGYYYVLDNVKGINSIDNEWSLSFLDRKKAALTYSDVDKQTMMVARMIRPDKFSIESGMYIPKEGHVGALSVKDGYALFASNATSEIEDENTEIATSSETVYYELPYYEILGNSDIYSAKITGNQFSDIQNAGKRINYDNKSWESQPALSPDGGIMFYASDRPGGKGGTDIWYSIRMPDGSWSHPINAGDSINTRCDELTPFVTADGTELLFASAGHETVGGYDLFKANINKYIYSDGAKMKLDFMKVSGDYFTRVRNMRPPLNTPADELFPTSPGDPDSLLYFSSNQNAGRTSLVLRRGGFDIFVRYREISPYLAAETIKDRSNIDIGFNDEADLSKNADDRLKNLPFYTLEGTIFNADTRIPVADAEITIRELPGREITQTTSTNATGTYQVKLDKDREYEITAQGKDLFFDSFKMRIEKEDPTESVSKNVYLPLKLELRLNFPLDNSTDPYKYILDTNGVETNKTWQRELDLLANNIKHSIDKLEKINLVGHTDYLGSTAYNNRLGKKRVDFVISELVKRGIPEELLTGRSAGELEPIQKRKGENEKMFRKRLRRVSLEKVLKL